jgi:hypothetical protein
LLSCSLQAAVRPGGESFVGLLGLTADWGAFWLTPPWLWVFVYRMPPGFTRSCLGGLCSLVWADSSSSPRVSVQCSASWPVGSTQEHYRTALPSISRRTRHGPDPCSCTATTQHPAPRASCPLYDSPVLISASMYGVTQQAGRTVTDETSRPEGLWYRKATARRRRRRQLMVRTYIRHDWTLSAALQGVVRPHDALASFAALTLCAARPVSPLGATRIPSVARVKKIQISR